MKLFIDLDGVCADFYGRLIDLYNRDYKDSITINDISSWVLDSSNFPKAPEGSVKKYLNTPGFWRGLACIPGSQEVLERLVGAGHDVIVATGVPFQSRLAFYEKAQWVAEHFPFIPRSNFVGISRKSLLTGGMLFDDYARNILSFKGPVSIMDTPYNRNVHRNNDYNTYRVRSWEEFEVAVGVESAEVV